MQITIDKVYAPKGAEPYGIIGEDGTRYKLWGAGKNAIPVPSVGQTVEAVTREDVRTGTDGTEYHNIFITSWKPCENGSSNGVSHSESPSQLTWKDKLILAQSSAKTAVDLLSQCPNETFEQLHIKVYNHCLSVAGLDYDPFQ